MLPRLAKILFFLYDTIVRHFSSSAIGAFFIIFLFVLFFTPLPAFAQGGLQLFPQGSECSKYNCNGTRCTGTPGNSYCNITSKPGDPKQCQCTDPPSPPPPPCPKANQDKNGICIKIDTAIGAISTTPAGFAKSIFGIVLSLSGGIALLLIIMSGYQIMSSQGDPEKVQGAKDTITSTIIGLVFILFSLVVLQIIGVDIIRVPGLSK